jgi:hypothetical protein
MVGGTGALRAAARRPRASPRAPPPRPGACAPHPARRRTPHAGARRPRTPRALPLPQPRDAGVALLAVRPRSAGGGWGWPGGAADAPLAPPPHPPGPAPAAGAPGVPPPPPAPSAAPRPATKPAGRRRQQQQAAAEQQRGEQQGAAELQQEQEQAPRPAHQSQLPAPAPPAAAPAAAAPRPATKPVGRRRQQAEPQAEPQAKPQAEPQVEPQAEPQAERGPSQHSQAAAVAERARPQSQPQAQLQRGAPALSVTTVKNFFKLEGCQRYLALSQRQRAAAAAGAGAGRAAPAAEPFDPALAEAGEQQERSVLGLVEAWLAADPAAAALGLGDAPRARVHNPTGDGACPWSGVAAALPALLAARRRAAWREVQLPEGGVAPMRLGVRLTGRIDFLLLAHGPAGPALVVVECKSSAAPDTSHYAQLACYRLALRELLREAPAPGDGGGGGGGSGGGIPVRCALVTAADLPHALRRGGAGGGAPPLAPAAAAAWVDAAVAGGAAEEVVAQMEGDVVAALRPGGPGHRALLAGAAAAAAEADAHAAPGARTRAQDAAVAAASRDIEELPFTLGRHCDGCPGAAARACRVRCAARGAVQLAGAGPGATAALAAAGVRDLAALAGLGVGGGGGGARAAAPAGVPALEQLATRARLLLQEQRTAGGAAPAPVLPPQVMPNPAAPAHSKLPPLLPRAARAYLVCEFDPVTQRLAAMAAHCAVGGPSGGDGRAVAGAAPAQPPLQQEPHSLVWSSGAADRARAASTFVRCVHEAFTTSGGGSGKPTSGALAATWAAVAAGPASREVQGAAAQEAAPAEAAVRRDDVLEALLITEVWERLLAFRAASGAACLHVVLWGAGGGRRLAARAYALLARGAICGSARFAQALRGLLLLLGARGALHGLPGAAEAEHTAVGSLQSELMTRCAGRRRERLWWQWRLRRPRSPSAPSVPLTSCLDASSSRRFVTPHLRPSLPEALALRWAAGGAPHSWRRAYRASAPDGAAAATEEADGLALWPVEPAAASSHAAPGALAAYWMGGPHFERPPVAGAAAPPAPELAEAYRPYGAAARGPGAFEAMLASKAEALAALEARMLAARGGSNSDGGLESSLCGCPAAQPAPAGGVPPPRRAADVPRDEVAALREAAAAPWAALAAGDAAGLARAALDALRLDRAGAAAEAAADAARPLRERVGGLRALLLQRVPATGEVGGKVLFEGAVVDEPPGPAAAEAPADARGALPFAEGDWVRLTGLQAPEAAEAWEGGVARALSAAGASPAARGANAKVALVARDAATGRAVFRLEGVMVAYRRPVGDRAARLAHYHAEPFKPPEAFAFDFAVVEASTSEWVGEAVDGALCRALEEVEPAAASGGGAAVSVAERPAAWLWTLLRPPYTAAAPRPAPFAPALQDAATALLARVRWPLDGGGEGRLHADQVQAVAAGLSARVQLMQGPPGTGECAAARGPPVCPCRRHSQWANHVLPAAPPSPRPLPPSPHPCPRQDGGAGGGDRRGAPAGPVLRARRRHQPHPQRHRQRPRALRRAPRQLRRRRGRRRRAGIRPGVRTVRALCRHRAVGGIVPAGPGVWQEAGGAALRRRLRPRRVRRARGARAAA